MCLQAAGPGGATFIVRLVMALGRCIGSRSMTEGDTMGLPVPIYAREVIRGPSTVLITEV